MHGRDNFKSIAYRARVRLTWKFTMHRIEWMCLCLSCDDWSKFVCKKLITSICRGDQLTARLFDSAIWWFTCLAAITVFSNSFYCFVSAAKFVWKLPVTEKLYFEYETKTWTIKKSEIVLFICLFFYSFVSLKTRKSCFQLFLYIFEWLIGGFIPIYSTGNKNRLTSTLISA